MASPPDRTDSNAPREARDLREKVWDLERRLDKQAAIIQALCSLLEKQGLTAAAVLQEVRKVEEDRAASATKPCTRCGRAIGRRQIACVYCGEPRIIESAFEEL